MRQRILVVEDDPHFGQQLADLFEFHGYEVEVAGDGPAGVEAFEHRGASLLLVDIMLPGMGGVELVRCIRGLQGGGAVPTLLMSAIYKNPRMFERELRELRVLEFLAKPFSLIDLGRRVDALLDAELELAAEQAKVTATGSWRLDEIAQALGEAPLPFELVGSFDRLSLLNMLIDIFVSHAAGRLVLKRGRSERQIYFLNGYPVWALSDVESERLGEVLVALELIARPQMQAALDRATRDGIMFREALIRSGFIDDARLFRAERERVKQVVVQSFGWVDGEYEFVTGDDFVDRVGVFEVNPVPCLLDAVRRFLSINQLAPDIEPRSSHHFVEGPRFRQLIPYFHLPPEHGGLVDRFDSGATVADLFREHPQSQEMLVKALWLMFRLGIADSKPGPERLTRPETGPGSPAPDRPEPITSTFVPLEEEDLVDFDLDDEDEDEPEPASPAIREIIQDYVTFMEADYYRFLRVDRDATLEDMAAAYQQLHLRYRANRLGQAVPSEVRRKAKELVSRLEVAYRTLSSPEGRRSYDSRLAVLESGEWQRQSAVDLLQEARGLIAQEDWAGAEPALRELLDIHPKALEALSLLGRVLQMRARGSRRILQEAWEVLRLALGEDPLHLRTLRYFGEVCRELRDADGYRLTVATIRTIDPQDPWLMLETVRRRRG